MRSLDILGGRPLPWAALLASAIALNLVGSLVLLSGEPTNVNPASPRKSGQPVPMVSPGESAAASSDSIQATPEPSTSDRRTARTSSARDSAPRRSGGSGSTTATSQIDETITFARYDPKGPVRYGIWSIEPKTRTERLLIEQAGYEVVEPAWSPDGSKIAFAQHNSSERFIAVAHEDGSNIIRHRSRNQGPGFVTNPSWSPDGSKIIFVEGSCEAAASVDDCSNPTSDLITRSSIRSVNPDGTGEVVVKSSEGPGVSFWSPAWAPSGSRIVFARLIDGRWDLMSTNPDGTDEVNLTATSDIDEYEPAWSPNSRRIAFASSRNLGQPSRRIWNNSSIEFMTERGSNRSIFATGWDPAWSPDGQSIAFVELDALFVARVDNPQEPRRLTRTGAPVSGPSFRPRR